jgi:DtxR family Mn-dependent transcriptional regulator
MTDHKYGTAHAHMSENEEMYLVTAAQLAATLDEGPVPLSLLAQKLNVQPVSVNQMVRKLADGGLLDYLPYKGVCLTAEGSRLAGRVLRSRQLWCAFFSTHLNLPHEEADALACRMEHITPDAVAERLEEYLSEAPAARNDLSTGTDGKSSAHAKGTRLDGLGVGAEGRIVDMHGPANILAFLDAEGFHPDAVVTVQAAGHGGTLLCALDDHLCCLTPSVAATVTVSTVDSPTNTNERIR